METRSRVAAAAASVVPFHCVICFDEFNMTDRPPVVLPCGHTYVCAPCTKRLRRCMECREPLFLPAAVQHQPTRNPVTQGNWAGTAPPMYNRAGKYNHSPQQQHNQTYSASPPDQHHHNVSAPAAAPIALPIPKNVVLLAMMEAAQRQSQMQEKEEAEANADDDNAFEGSGTSSIVDDDEDDEDQFDLNRIISGMATLSGPCGTYAVREKEGLAVMSSDPRRKQHVDEEKKTQEDIPSPVQISVVKDPFALEYGQTVQIVDFEDGVAKLGRGRGFIVANSSQLVKVAGPLDSSCRLEGLLDTVVSRGMGLQRTLDENHDIEMSLRKQLEAAEEALPIHPIITEAPKRDDLSDQDCRDTLPSTLPSTPTGSRTGSERDVLAQPVLSTPPRTPSRDVIIMQSASMEAEVSMTPAASAHGAPSPNSIDNSDIAGPGFPSYRRTADDEYDLHELALGCGAAFFSGNAALFGESLSKACKGITGTSHSASDAAFRNNENARTVRTSTSNSSDPASPLWQNAPILSTSFDTVDFRNGLSGHRGLTSSAKSSGSSPNTRGFPRMSDHHGIARARGKYP